MRKKKDPGIRQEEFIQAAQALFLERGYEGVSVQAVLDAVGERAASPSVFYYYFRSKDDLYQACLRAAAKRYLLAMQKAFEEDLPQGQELPALAKALEQSLAAYGGILLREKGRAAVPNRLVILDLRDQVTQEIEKLWAPFLLRLGMTGDEAALLSRFLAGGIGELLYAYLLAGDTGEASRRRVLRAIAEFTMRALKLPDKKQQTLLAELERQEEADGDA